MWNKNGIFGIETVLPGKVIVRFCMGVALLLVPATVLGQEAAPGEAPESAPTADPSGETAVAAPAEAVEEVVTEAVEPEPVVKKKKKKKKKSRGAGMQLAGIHINGRFDLAYEWSNFALDDFSDQERSFKNYHHFIFLTRHKEDEPVGISVELIDLSFYELTLKVNKASRFRFGKIVVPFGSDPLFHHSYGGRSGFDQKLLPVVWAEHGVVYDANLYSSGTVTIDNELYMVSGFSGTDDQVVKLNGASNPNEQAYGNRLRVGCGLYTAALSLYAMNYAESNLLFASGIDVAAGPGFIPVSGLDDLSLKIGYMRADIQSETLGDYYHFGDYVELGYRLPWSSGLRYRTGSVTMENHRGVFFDDRSEHKTADDASAHSLTVWKRHHGFSVAAELIINMEQAGEVDNDLFRVTGAVDF